MINVAAFESDHLGEAVLRGSIQLAVVCYLVRVAILLRGRQSEWPTVAECAVWTLGCAFYLIHLYAAFAHVHFWSHAAAVQHTAEETARVTGIRRGDGVWVNYVFTIIWVADCLRLITARLRHQKTNRRINRGTQIIFAFIVFNATVVFGPAVYRWLLLPVVAILWWMHRLAGRPSLKRPDDRNHEPN